MCDLCKHALDVQLVLLLVQLALLHVQLASLDVQLALRARSRCILRRAVRIPRDPTAVTLSGCDDRWTRVELDPPPLTHCSLSLTILTGKVDLRGITIGIKCDLL